MTKSKAAAQLTTAEKLRTLARHIQKLPHESPANPKEGVFAFNMADFASTVEDDNGKNICGAVCCMAGEAVRLFAPEKFTYCALGEGSFMTKATDILGITDYEADYLFLGNFTKQGLSDIKPARAARALRELAKKYDGLDQ